jgi:hypothetical protein
MHRSWPIDHFVNELVDHANEPQGWAKIRNVLPDFVDIITVDLTDKEYAVWMKGATQPVTVSLNKNGPVFSPSPV